MLKPILVAAALFASGSAMAWPADSVADPYGANAIAAARADALQDRLVARYDRGDRRPEVLLNLAAIRTQQNHRGEARALYKMVLDQPNIDMATLNGSAWSHEIARRGLARDQALASR